MEEETLPEPASEKVPEDLPSDAQICKWMAEARDEQGEVQSKRYWGETLTCPSVS